MNILWTVNILFPEAKSLLEHSVVPFASSGGWLIGAAQTLAAMDGIQLHIACPARVPELTVLQGERIRYYLFPVIKRTGEPFYGDCPRLDAVFKEIIQRSQPDIIDIHGTEYAHSLSCFRASAGIPQVVTIQGFIDAVAKHYRDGLSLGTILLHRRPFHHGVLSEQRGYARRGRIENRWLTQVPCFIGRTDWDRAHVLSLNPRARYFTCQETLRDAFYDGKWTWEGCEKHSIFLSQGSYPLKALHQVLRALPAVLEQYPDARLYIGGANILAERHRANYARIVAALRRRHHMKDKVIFVGNLDADAMKEQFLKSNVFLCPSTVENSSNSLGEAQCLGVPCIAAATGGTPSMIPDERCGYLYPFHDTRKLADLICDVFAQEAAFDNSAMREMAHRRHDRTRNVQTLLSIYQDVMSTTPRAREKNYLVVSLDVAETAPGIVFKQLIGKLSASSRLTLMGQHVDPSILSDKIRLIPLSHGVQCWRRASKKWRSIGHNPRDERWTRLTFRCKRKELFKERYDALIVLTSNGYYSALNLGRILKEHLHCPYIIYSVDGMPSPLPWLDGDERLHRNISAELNRLCADADLFVLSNPMMVGYQQRILRDFKGKWDCLFTPYKPLSTEFTRQAHEGFNILYAGSLYGLRKTDGLIEAFRKFLSIRPDATLCFIGGMAKKYKQLGKDLVKAGKIFYKDATDRIDEYYAKADCLIDIAADIPDDVFLSSKAICYLPYPIPVIAISGENSPVSQIMGNVPSILQCKNDADEIFAALQAAPLIQDFSDRKDLLEGFHPSTLGERFRTLVEGVLKPEQLIVTLTTWKARFGNIPGVLDSIFRQTLPPDKVVLNLALDETIPDELQSYLDLHQVEVNRVPDTKVYKKLIPTLKKYPDACVVNIDDDWLYPPEMLEEFMRIHQQHPDAPISGNRERAFHLPCHCGCASLTQRKFFGPYLDCIDEEVMQHCPSDDLVYTFFARKNGYTYLRTQHLYFENMTPYHPSAPYSIPNGTPIYKSWAYLTERFGLPVQEPLKDAFRKVSCWIFELNRDQYNKKYLRVLGIRFNLK